MFSNLIESGSHAADLKRKGRFFLATTAFYGLLLAAAGVGSVYAYNAKLDYDPDYELVSLLRFPPVEARSEEPRRDEQRAASTPARTNQIATRTEISMQTPYPKRVASRETPEIRQNQAVILADFNSTPEVSGGPVGPASIGSTHGTDNNTGGPVVTGAVEPPPPPPPPTTKPTPAPRQETGPVRVPSSLISSKTLEKPAPPYPPIAKAANVQGTVSVQIVIDEQGKVISAKAASGHPLLLSAAVQAAYRARFTPTFLGGQAVKVTGSITYNFILN